MTCAVGNYLTGWTPGVHLNEKGREEVDVLGRNLAGLPIAAIYSSPLERARETAEAVAAHHSLTIEFRDRLGEVRTGDWTGRRIADLDANDPAWREWNLNRSITRTPNGESYLELQDRMVSELTTIARDQPSQIVAVVSHADPIRAALVQFLGMPGDFSLRLDIRPASVSVLHLGSGPPRIAAVNIPIGGITGLLDRAW
jgi:probable phosphoglycerate mutase